MTEIEHFDLVATCAQLLLCEKLEDTEIPEIFKTAEPEFVTVMVFGLLMAPTTTFPNASEVLDKVTVCAESSGVANSKL